MYGGVPDKPNAPTHVRAYPFPVCFPSRRLLPVFVLGIRCKKKGAPNQGTPSNIAPAAVSGRCRFSLTSADRRIGQEAEERDTRPEKPHARIVGHASGPQPFHLVVQLRPVLDITPQLHQIDDGTFHPLDAWDGRAGNVVDILANFDRCNRVRSVGCPPLFQAAAYRRPTDAILLGQRRLV